MHIEGIMHSGLPLYLLLSCDNGSCPRCQPLSLPPRGDRGQGRVEGEAEAEAGNPTSVLQGGVSGVFSSRGHGHVTRNYSYLWTNGIFWDRRYHTTFLWLFPENDRNPPGLAPALVPRDSLGQLSDSRGHDRNLEIAQCLPFSNSDTRKRKLPLFANYNS